jgi:hypothetical protein
MQDSPFPSADEPAPEGDILDALESLCEGSGATIPVTPADYLWFAELGNEEMAEIVRLVVMDRAAEISDFALNRRGTDAELFDKVCLWLEFIALRRMVFGPTGDLRFFKPVGPEPTAREDYAIADRIESARPMIGPAILRVMRERPQQN